MKTELKMRRNALVETNTSNSVIVSKNKDNLTGKIIEVEINEFNHNTLFGNLVNQNDNYVAAANMSEYKKLNKV